MTSSKRDVAMSQLTSLLHEWDSGSKSVRRRILQDFVAQNKRKTAPELDAEFADATSLFLTRITSWLRLTYMIGTCLTDQLQALQIFLAATSGHRFLDEFLEVGGVLTVVEILSVKQAKEADKTEALKLLICVASAGRQYKEIICEGYGVRAAAECVARSRSEETQECACRLLRTLADGNPKFQTQVYQGLIALLPSSSAKAQHMAAQSLRIVQPIVGTAHTSIIDPLLGLLKTLHLEVQFEALELIQLLMAYEVRGAILEGLVRLLRPTTDDIQQQLDILNDPSVDGMSHLLPVYVQQATAAKCLGILLRMSSDTADELLELPILSNLMYSMGNVNCADSQRQAASTLQYMCQTFPAVNETVRKAMGDVLYERFMTEPETLYMKMNDVQADLLKSNNIR